MIPALWELTDYTLNTLESQNIAVVWGYQNSARVPKPYVMLNYTTVDLPDHEIYGEVDENGIRTIGSFRKAVIDMQFYCAQDSIKVASRLATAFAKDKSLNKQVELNCSIGNRLFLQRIPALLNASQYEDRAIYQFDFYYDEDGVATEDVGLIETVVIHGEYGGSGSHGEANNPPFNTHPGDPHNLICDEVISIHSQTIWDNGLTSWDEKTIWDGLLVDGDWDP